jgi:hypothetical protein
MMKNFADTVWNNGLGIKERLALLYQLPKEFDANDLYKKQWEQLPEDVQTKLRKIDWEFSLGKKLV